MAETTTISLEDSSESSSVSVSLETPDKSAAPITGDATEDIATVRQERDALRQRNEQYLRERNGWEAQSRRNLEERQELATRLARLEGHVQATTSQSTATSPDPQYTPGQLKGALDKWLNGDAADLDMVEHALAKFEGRSAAQQFKPDDLKKIVREELLELGTKGNLQTIVGTRYPDMANPQSDMSKVVWQQYDAFAADTANQLLYERNPKYDVPMTGPDGSQRMVDARIVERLCTEVRLQGGILEGRRQESQAAQIGSVQGGSGRTTTAGSRRTVEAIELLTPGELHLLQDPKIRKGWPQIPEDAKAAAKFLYDQLPAGEKTKRLAAYRQGHRVGA